MGMDGTGWGSRQTAGFDIGSAKPSFCFTDGMKVVLGNKGTWKETKISGVGYFAQFSHIRSTCQNKLSLTLSSVNKVAARQRFGCRQKQRLISSTKQVLGPSRFPINWLSEAQALKRLERETHPSSPSIRQTPRIYGPFIWNTTHDVGNMYNFGAFYICSIISRSSP
jgi:hypothetical protein